MYKVFQGKEEQKEYFLTTNSEGLLSFFSTPGSEICPWWRVWFMNDGVKQDLQSAIQTFSNLVNSRDYELFKDILIKKYPEFEDKISKSIDEKKQKIYARVKEGSTALGYEKLWDMYMS